MNDKELYNTRQHDANLREAIARRAQKRPQMPADLNERLMERVEMRPPRPSIAFRWMWPTVAACIVAAFFIGYSQFGRKREMLPSSSTVSAPVIYASVADTSYQSPALVDEFIAKLAASYGIEQEPQDSLSTLDASSVDYIYVFPEEKEVDVFGRLLQVACWYDNNSPGYQLHLSQSQFLFELQDVHEGRNHLWLAEKIGTNTFLYGVNVPIGVTLSNANYMDYRNQHIMGKNRYRYYKL